MVIGRFKISDMSRSLTDWFKVVAAIAVVGIHATSQSEISFAASHEVVSLDFLGVVVNQWARFSVPIFLYLSAYGLTLSQKNNEDSGLFRIWLGFLRRRLPTILIPYLFFSTIALAMEFQSYQGGAADTAAKIFTKLRTGGADYHLYFLVILAQCYVVFPLLANFARTKTRAFTLTTWLALILVSGLLYKGSSEILLAKLGVTHPGWHASFAIYWLPYFMLGVLHAVEAPVQLNRAAITIALIAVQLIVLLEYMRYSSQGAPVDYYNHFSRPSVMFYVLVVVWWLHSPPSAQHGEGGKGGGVARLAPLTFSVYLIHPQVLRLLTHYATNLPGIFMWMITVIATFALVYGLTLLTNMGTQKSPALMAGPVGFFQRCLGLR